MIRLAIALALAPGLALTPSLASAACPEITLVSCGLANSAKRVELCLTGDSLRYRFGTAQNTELELIRDVAEASYTPWPGIGRTMWEELSLENAGTTYQFSSYAEKLMEEGTEDQLALGTDLLVLRGEKVLAKLTCDPAQVSDLYPVGKALHARGYCLGEDGWRKGAGAWRCE